MPMYSIVARDRAGGLEHRQAVRPEHLKHLDSLGEKLVLAGPFQTEDGKSVGSFMVIEAEDLDAPSASVSCALLSGRRGEDCGDAIHRHIELLHVLRDAVLVHLEFRPAVVDVR